MEKKKQEKSNRVVLIHAISEILEKESVETQDQICEILLQKGFESNQTIVSRALNKLGAIKMNEAGRNVYRLPHEMAVVAPHYSLQQLILNISNNENLIVIQTTPGSAQLIARLLDQQKEIKVLGTVAGDDTVLVIPLSVSHVKDLRDKIFKLLIG